MCAHVCVYIYGVYIFFQFQVYSMYRVTEIYECIPKCAFLAMKLICILLHSRTSCIFLCIFSKTVLL